MLWVIIVICVLLAISSISRIASPPSLEIPAKRLPDLLSNTMVSTFISISLIGGFIGNSGVAILGILKSRHAILAAILMLLCTGMGCLALLETWSFGRVLPAEMKPIAYGQIALMFGWPALVLIYTYRLIQRGVLS